VVPHPPIDLEAEFKTFRGDVRLFPLPDFVLFPDGLAPLRVFEARYIALVEDALEDDGRIALALLKRTETGEIPTGDQPPIHPVVTVGKIVRHTRTPEGHFEILLYGLFRARILSELPHTPYRKARVAVEIDLADPEQAERIADRMRRALDLVPGKQPLIWEMRRMANSLRGVDAGAGRYADAVANVSDLSALGRYEILAEPDVLVRFERLIQRLEQAAYADQPLPPAHTQPRLN